MKNTILNLTLISFALFAMAGCGKGVKTTENLKTAIAGETEAMTKYAAFSLKAAEDGHYNIAKLFAATSYAEGVHIVNHKRVLQRLEGEPEPEIAFIPDVGNTAENLQGAIDGETYEHSEMYPAFLRVSRSEDIMDASRYFDYALKAEQKHAALYGDALRILNDTGSDETLSTTWYVCEVCGDIYPNIEGLASCYICGENSGNFILIE